MVQFKVFYCLGCFPMFLSRLLFSALVLASLAACTDPQTIYRMIDPADDVCLPLYQLGPKNREHRQKGMPHEQNLRCFLQTHELPADPTPGGYAWRAEADRFGRDLKGGNRYHLAFVEMSEAGTQHLPAQMRRLRGHLRDRQKAGQQNYVVAYVHGWRHDAEILDRDVENLRLVLAYTRAALNTRCVARGEYCNTALTGVFLAWRGRQFKEPPSVQGRGGDLFKVMAAPTFWNRLQQSTSLGETGKALETVLEDIHGQLKIGTPGKKANKLLIFGHSMGGNMLATLMEKHLLDSKGNLVNHQAPALGATGREFKPVFGDLVVLLNAASKASRWTSLQRAERKLAGLENDHYLTSNDGGRDVWRREKSDRLRVWRSLYPITQRPVYISLTSTANWWLGQGRNRPINHDSATGAIFPLGRSVSGVSARENRIAIGHLLPNYRADRLELVPGAEPVGLSHEFIVRQGALVTQPDGTRVGQKAAYKAATDPMTSWCEPANGWLLAARQEARRTNAQGQTTQGTTARFDQFWAYGDGTENIAPQRNGASVLWRHQINLDDRKRGLSVVPGTSPFWNVRTLDTAIRGHRNWVSYPMWCALNQLVLDDVTAQRRVDPNVKVILDAQPEQNIGDAAN